MVIYVHRYVTDGLYQVALSDKSAINLIIHPPLHTAFITRTVLQTFQNFATLGLSTSVLFHFHEISNFDGLRRTLVKM